MPVDWNMAIIDPLKQQTEGSDYVNKLYDQAATLNAGRQYAAGDYTGAAQTIGARGDFATAEKLRSTGTNLAAGQQYASGDYSGASKTLAQGGNVQGAEDLAQKQAETFMKQQAVLQQTTPFLAQAVQQHPDKLSDAFDMIAPSLQAAGTAPDRIAQYKQSFLANPQQTVQLLQAMAAKKWNVQKTEDGSVIGFDENNPTSPPLTIYQGQGNPADWEVKNVIEGGQEKTVRLNKRTGQQMDVGTAGPRFNPSTIINNQDSGWQLANDPATNTQYRINVRTGQTLGLDGKPYQAQGAAKIQSGTARSAAAMGVQRFMQENPNATSADIASYAGQYKKTVEQVGGEAKADVSALTQTTKLGTQASAQEQALSGAIQQATQLMNKGAGTSAGPIINQWLQAGRKATGNPDVAAFDTAIRTAANEYAKIITGSNGATDASRSEAASMLNQFQSPQAIMRQIAVIQKDAHYKIQSYADHAQFIRDKLNSGQSGSSIPASAAPAPAASAPSQGWGKATVVKP